MNQEASIGSKIVGSPDDYHLLSEQTVIANYIRDFFQPISNGLHPRSDGLQPGCGVSASQSIASLQCHHGLEQAIHYLGTLS